MGPKFSIFIFALCLSGVMVSKARVRAPRIPSPGLHDVKKSSKYRRSIENLYPPRPAAHGKKFRENDVKIAEK